MSVIQVKARELIWQGVAKIVSQPVVADWLIERSKRTPYEHIKGPDGSIYMERYWLFNPYTTATEGNGEGDDRKWKWLPSIRIHWIRRADIDRHLHDHPWNARTIILKGDYAEYLRNMKYRERPVGATGRLGFGEFHRIDRVAPEGAWTLFICGKSRGDWGFDVNGVKVPHKKYLAQVPQ
jgi:hypothetical protein